MVSLQQYLFSFPKAVQIPPNLPPHPKLDIEIQFYPLHDH